MAKIKPVIKSVMILTEVALSLPYAKFFYDSWTTHAPLPGMNVNVHGFLNPTNNVISQIETTTGGTPGWFTITNFGCIPEIHAAIAHAQSALPELCTNAPNPYTSQAMQKTTNRNGCIYKPKHPRKGTKSSSMMNEWPINSPETLLHCNQRMFTETTKHWKNDLGPAERADWETKAALATLQNYEGKIITPTGFQLYVAITRASMAAIGNPDNPGPAYYAGFWPTYVPGWPTPTTHTFDEVWWDYHGSYSIYFNGDYVSSTDGQFARLVVARAPRPGGNTPQHNLASTLQGIGQVGTRYRMKADLRFPFKKKGELFPITLGMQIYDNAAQTLSHWCWWTGTPQI
jgi:hypothetical protein